jgi:ankyrin repeat protein
MSDYENNRKLLNSVSNNDLKSVKELNEKGVKNIRAIDVACYFLYDDIATYLLKDEYYQNVDSEYVKEYFAMLTDKSPYGDKLRDIYSYKDASDCNTSIHGSSLHIAAIRNDVKNCKKLLKKFNTSYILDRDKLTPFFRACISNNYDVLSILYTDKERRVRNDYNQNALFDITNIDIIKFLINKGFNVNHKDVLRNTPLSIITARFQSVVLDDVDEKERQKLLDIINLYLTSGANPNIGNEEGEYPLTRIFFSNDYEALKLIIDYCNVDLMNYEWFELEFAIKDFSSIINNLRLFFNKSKNPGKYINKYNLVERASLNDNKIILKFLTEYKGVKI